MVEGTVLMGLSMKIKSLLGYCRHHYRVTIVTSTIRAVLQGKPLPPGKFLVLDSAEQSDQEFLLKHAEQVGPVFKVVFEDKLTICVVGLPICRRFLHENASNMMLQAINLEEIFPLGFLRRMEGETHKKYRKAVMRAIDPERMSRDQSVFENIVVGEFGRYAENPTDDAFSPQNYIDTLNTITSSCLIYIFFGALAGSERFEALMKMYKRLGPKEVEWSVGEQQKKAFFQIRDYLLQELDQKEEAWDDGLRQSIVGQMHKEATLDETSLGNLIYMVEIGRYDLRLLFRWLSKYGSENPEVLDEIHAESLIDRQGKTLMPEAFVLETLRLSQSEVLMRVVKRDIVFDGHHIPKNFIVRLCIWESHKLPESFQEPFAFRPERFTGEAVSKNLYSPFGMDHHSCPFGSISIKLSSIFIDVMAKNYTVTAVGNSGPTKGRYHWQPADSFSVDLVERQAGTG